MKIDVKSALLKVSELLKKAEIKGFQRESAMILSEIIDKPTEYIYIHPEDEISEENLQKSLNLAEKRASGMPMAYVLNKKDFFGLEFKVNSNTLIPRPETEMMIDKAIEWTKSFGKDEKLLILDIGTGSGCIPIAIAKNVGENVEFIAVDFSENALRVARKNIDFHKLSGRIKLERSDLLKAVNIENFEQKNILITANLPYLSTEIYNNSPSSVQDFEPKEALISGDDGLDHYRRLFDQIQKFVILSETSETSEVDRVLPKALAVTQGSADRRINVKKDSSTALSRKSEIAPLRMTRAKSLEILLEISPEQKELIENLIKEKFGDKKVEVSVKKDLADKYRLVIIRVYLLFRILDL